VPALPDALADVAEVVFSLRGRGAACYVGQPEGGPLLDGYVAHMLVARLEQFGVAAHRLRYAHRPGTDGPPPCLLRTLRARGRGLYVEPVTFLEEGERWLRVSACDVVTGRQRTQVRLEFHLPEELEALVAGTVDRLSSEDARWLTLLERMFPAPEQDEPDGQSVLRLAAADYFFDRGLWEAAAERYLDEAGASPTRPLALGVMSAQLAGEWERAESRLQDGLNQHFDSGPLYALGGWLMLRQNKPEDALMLLEQARVVDIAREGLYVYARGLMALENPDTEVAEQLLTRAADLLPDNTSVQVEAGRLHWNRADLERALEYYRRATKTPGCTADTWAELAMVLDASGDLEEAARALRQAFRLRNDSTVITRHLAAVLRRLGQHGEALAVLRGAAEANPCRPGLLAAYGDGAAEMWRTEIAEAQFRRATSVTPDFAYGRVRLAEILAVQRRYREAQSLLTELLAERPDYPPARLALGRMLGELGRTAEGASLLKEVAKDPQHEATARLALAELHRRASHPEEAVQHAQIAVSCREDAQTYAALCEAFLGADQVDKADTAAQSAAESGAHSAEAHAALARVRRAQDRLDEALEHAEEALEINPYSVGALRLLGGIRKERGELRECAAAWQRALALDRWHAEMHFELSRLLGEQLDEPEAAVEHYARYLELERMRAEAGR
jgi:tetratricopeptide (TPR) repeat protein